VSFWRKILGCTLGLLLIFLPFFLLFLLLLILKTPAALFTTSANLPANSFMQDKIMPLSQAVEGYDLFDKMKVQKVIFKAQE